MIKSIRLYMVARKIEKAKRELVAAYLKLEEYSAVAGQEPPPRPPASAFKPRGFWKLLWTCFGPTPKEKSHANS